MLKKLSFLLFLFSSLLFFAQNETKKWFFGNGAGIDFSTTPPTTLTTGQITTTNGCASMADASGNLLFYTNGITVWNQTHAVMAKWKWFSGK